MAAQDDLAVPAGDRAGEAAAEPEAVAARADGRLSRAHRGAQPSRERVHHHHRRAARQDARTAEQTLMRNAQVASVVRRALRAQGHPGDQGHPDHERLQDHRHLGAGLRVHHHRAAGPVRVRVDWEAQPARVRHGQRRGVRLWSARNPWDLDRAAHQVPPADRERRWRRTSCRCRSAPTPAGRFAGRPPFCGIVGLKQTYGSVSRHGVTTLAWTLDHAGPMTRTVADAAAMLQIIAGADPRDASCTADPVSQLLAAVDPDLKGLRIGVPTRHFTDGRARGRRAGRIRARSMTMQTQLARPLLT